MSQTKVTSRLTIHFDCPYWVGILEAEYDEQLYVTRYIFGAEPSDQEVYEFVQREWGALQAQMTVGIAVEATAEHSTSYKRMQRQVRREVVREGVSTKAQDAMRLQIEQSKQVHHEISREQRDAQRTYKREVARAKAKARHKGH